MENWVQIRRSANFKEIADKFGVSMITARLLRNRELLTMEDIDKYLHPDISELSRPQLLSGMEKAVATIRIKIKEKKPVCIIGDYDVDGICATYILYKGLTFFGAIADYMIPHRIEDGYGINQTLIEKAHEKGADTIITCDNGIAAFEQSRYAKELGMSMIITDHHEIPYDDINGERKYKIPVCDAVVDPKLPDNEYPFEGICGAYVAYQFIRALSETTKCDSRAVEQLLSELMEFAALATVCDVMEIRDENRILVKEGLRLMRHSKNIGLRTLIEACGLNDKILTPMHLGFVIGPCLNASGRLDTSMKGMELLCADNYDDAARSAQYLRELNEERKSMTTQQLEKAIEIVEKNGVTKVLVVFLPDCHESLAGIIAGRLREKYTHPAFVITRAEKGLKGSGRSIEQYNMFEELTLCSDLLTKFGGHKAAAGISLKEEDLEAFRERLNSNCKLEEKDFCEKLRIDMELPIQYPNLDLAQELLRLEPFGNGNERPLFASLSTRFLMGNRIGKNKNVGKYKVCIDGCNPVNLVFFGNLDQLEEYIQVVYGEEQARLFHSGQRIDVKLDIAYRIGINNYMGKDELSLQMQSYR